MRESLRGIGAIISLVGLVALVSPPIYAMWSNESLPDELFGLPTGRLIVIGLVSLVLGLLLLSAPEHDHA